jgi:hypothetical protein
MSKLNLCWPDRRGVDKCHTYLCDRGPTLQECPLSKGSPPSVIESTWVPCIQKAPFNCRDESIRPSAPNPAPAPVNVPSVNIASPTPAPTPTPTSTPPAPEPSVPTTTEAPVKAETAAPDLKVAQQVTEESEATYTIAGQEITQTNALIGIGVVGALSFLLVM